MIKAKPFPRSCGDIKADRAAAVAALADVRERMQRQRAETEDLLRRCGWTDDRLLAELGPLSLPG